MEYNNTLYSINPKNYTNLFSRTKNKNKKLIFRNIFPNKNYKSERNNSTLFISRNQDYNNTFNFFKTDSVPFPKFPSIKNKNKFNKKKLLVSKVKKEKNKNYFSIKYLELIKDINNQNAIKNYYYLNKNKNKKNKYLNENNKKLIQVFINNDFETLQKGINELYDIKNKLNEKNNYINEIKKIFNKNNNNKNYSHNIFLKEILNNINRKIEIYSREKNDIYIIYVKNLLLDELNKLEKNFHQIKKHIKILIKKNIINNYYNSPSKAFSYSSSSSISSEKNKKVYNQKYYEILLNNQKHKIGIKTFKNESVSVPSSFNLTQRMNNNLSLSQTIITSNYKDNNNFKPSITSYIDKRNKYYSNNKILNSNKASELIKEISNKIEKKYGTKIIQNYNQNFFSPQNIISNNNINNKGKNINSEIKENINYDFYLKKFSKLLSINNIQKGKKYIKNNIYIPKDNKIKKEKNDKKEKEINKEEEIDNNNMNNLNNIPLYENKYNNQVLENENNEKKDGKNEIKEEIKEETKFNPKYSIMTLFEEIKKNALIKDEKKQSKNNKLINDKSRTKIKKGKTKKYETNLKKSEEKNKEKITENDDNKIEDRIENYKSEFKRNNNKIRIDLSNKRYKDKFLEEVNIIRKEILGTKKLSVPKKINKNKINRKEFKDIKNKLSIINNINEMNFNEKEKEIILNNIFHYKYLLNKNPKTPEEIEKEEDIRKKLKAIVEKFIYELQIRELVNNQSVYSRKKKIIKKNIKLF